MFVIMSSSSQKPVGSPGFSLFLLGSRDTADMVTISNLWYNGL